MTDQHYIGLMAFKFISSDILNDWRFGTLNDHLYRRAFEFLVICDQQGLLPDVPAIAFLLRTTEDDVLESLRALSKNELTLEREGCWLMDIRHIGTYQQLRAEWMLIRKEMTETVFKRDGKFCRHCGATEDLTIDHIEALFVGGTNELQNLQVLCRSCNSSKGIR